MAYEIRTVTNLEMSGSERTAFNAMEPGVRKNLVAEYFRIRALLKKDPRRYATDWQNIQGLMLAHDGD